MDEAIHRLEGEKAFNTLRRIVDRLKELGIPYAVAGEFSLFAHGLRRFTDKVAILVTAEGLMQIHKELEGLGYTPPFAGSKNLRDSQSGVKIEFLVTRQFPGDGKPKPVAFPDPDSVAIERDGIRYLNLPTLIELKLASGMTSPERLKDLSDVMELVKLLDLSGEFSRQLAPFVREKYLEIWQSARPVAKRFLRLWSTKFLPPDAAELLDRMRADGVTVEPRGPTGDDVYLVTSDPAVARKYDMHEESEFWGDDQGRERPRE